jgi:hypothetical protein
LTGNVRRALIGWLMINNHQLTSAGQAAFIAIRPMRGNGFFEVIDEHNLDIS